MQTSKTRLIHKALLTIVLTSLCTGLPMPSSHAVPSSSAGGERIKDIAHIRGVRANQLFGYGIVVGLNRTGDSQQVRFATQTVASLLARLNVRISPQGLLLRNIATVMITADLPLLPQVLERHQVLAAVVAEDVQGAERSAGEDVEGAGGAATQLSS